MLQDILLDTCYLTAIIALRYLAVAGAAYFLLWERPEGRVRGVRLNRDRPARALIRHEIRASLIASPIYALPAAVVIALWQRGGTALYSDPDQYGWFYLAVSGLIYLGLHDTYYYWLHRAIHHRLVFRWIHAGHHRSRQPTPFASFSFDVAESVLSAWFVPALTLIIPIDVHVLLGLLTLMTVTAVMNHSGWEVMPRGWLRGRFGALAITASHHSLHHTRFGCNYGLYFRFWDRAMGTDQAPAGR